MGGEHAIEAVNPVLDPLQPLRDRAQPARQPFDVGGGGDVERAHRQLLRLGRLLARIERPPNRPRQQRVVEQVRQRLAEMVLAGAGEALTQVLHGTARVGHVAPNGRGRDRKDTVPNVSEDPPSRPARLFLFVQCELPWALGPPDGRYLLRSETDGEPERVIVLATLGASRAARAREAGPLRRRGTARRRAVPAQPEPEPVTTARATIVDPVSVSVERQARAWLTDLQPEREVAAAFAALNRVLHAQRIATADPYAREVSPAQALTIRAGWGEGEQVAEGQWLHAVELPLTGARQRVRRRASALRPDERLAEMLGAREQPLLCEELTLRARLDLDQGRLAHATIELDRALLAALAELAQEQRADLPLRVAELGALHEAVAAAARAILGIEAPGDDADAGEITDEPGAGGHDAPAQLDEETIRHALGRLEAALRARSAAGYDRP